MANFSLVVESRWGGIGAKVLIIILKSQKYTTSVNPFCQGHVALQLDILAFILGRLFVHLFLLLEVGLPSDTAVRPRFR
jgi:hypothetical protein